MDDHSKMRSQRSRDCCEWMKHSSHDRWPIVGRPKERKIFRSPIKRRFSLALLTALSKYVHSFVRGSHVALLADRLAYADPSKYDGRGTATSASHNRDENASTNSEAGLNFGAR